VTLWNGDLLARNTFSIHATKQVVQKIGLSGILDDDPIIEHYTICHGFLKPELASFFSQYGKIGGEIPRIGMPSMYASFEDTR
jgi:hypothetical protein